MLLNPRYSGPPIISLEVPDLDTLTPLVRQRRRMEALAATFDEADWATPSRCEKWTVRDVYAHLVSINPFYEMSAQAGLAGAPTELLNTFDPCTSPPAMVDDLGPLSGAEVLERFVATNNSLCATLTNMAAAEWDVLAESPPGLVPIRLLTLHALWDSWVHELDVCVPLRREYPAEPDELAASLLYVAALSPAFSIGAGRDYRGRFGVAASDPELAFTVTVDDSVHVALLAPGAGFGAGVPVLRGDTTALIDALTTRTPLPVGAPAEWNWLLNGLKTAWDIELVDEGSRPRS